MKTHPLRKERGVALVVVLVFLVLLSIFIIGFFSNSQDELSAAQSFTGEVSASHLAESAVSVVMGQIREATTRINGAWGSQPGMIRVYREGDVASEKADAFFKLYSSDDMIVSGEAEIGKFDPANEAKQLDGPSWQKTPALWTDLNEKVTVPIPNFQTGGASSVDRYPILDLGLEGRVEGLEFDAPPAGESMVRMPVKWLYVLKDGTLTAPTSFGGDGTRAIWQAGQRGPTAANPIVGRIAFWTDDETSKVNINTAGGFTTKPADSSKPPPAKEGPFDGGKPGSLGDDEYAGSFWDTPRFYTLFDRGSVDLDGAKGSDGSLTRGGLALSQPVRNEFQRYPGHPATTSLGIVFRQLTSGRVKQDSEYLFRSGQLALLSPRLMFSLDNHNERASNYGTDRLLAADLRNDPIDPLQSNDVPVSPRVKRLYASVDEMFYAQPDPKKVLPDGQRKENDFELGVTTINGESKVLTPNYLDKMRFVLTAHSRAPELNLYGQPRVTIWPVFDVTSRPEATWWNASDRLIAYCSTIGPGAVGYGGDQSQVLRYLFQRRDAYSATVDIKLQRNKKILEYLQDITKKPFPGFGGESFVQKYAKNGDPLGRDQILVEIFDYIRTVNLRDSTRDKKINETVLPLNQQENIREKEKYKYAPRGLVVPAELGLTASSKRHGFGRFPTVSEASIVLYVSGYVGTDGKRYLNSRTERNQFDHEIYGDRWVTDPATGKFLDKDGKLLTTSIDDAKAKGVKVKDVLIRAFFITETFNPMQGYAPTTAANGYSLEKGYIVMEIDNLHEFKLNNVPLGFPSTEKNQIGYSSGNLWGGRNSGGSEGFLHTMWDLTTGRPKNGLAPNVPGLGPPTGAGGPWYPFQTTGVTSGIAGTAFPYAGGNPTSITTATLQGPSQLKVKMSYSRDNTIVRNLVFDFSGSTQIPMPTDEVWSIRGTNGTFDGTYTGRAPGGFINDPTKRDQPVAWGSSNSVPIYDRLYAPGERTAKSLGDWYDPVSGKKLPGRLTWVQNDSNNHTGDKTPGPDYRERWRQILQPGDVVRSVVYGKVTDGGGDLRVSCLAVNDSAVASNVFQKHPDYGNTNLRHAQTLRMADAQLYYPDKAPALAFPSDPPTNVRNETRFGNITRLAINVFYPSGQAADLPPGLNGALRLDKSPGDFDTGIGNLADGPFCNKADEGNLAFRVRNNNSDGTFSHWTYPIPYFTWSYEETFDTFFSPNRQVPSPVVFGSLLTGKSSDWQTLCFSPNPAGNNHPGQQGTKDYLWLDLFTMPVVEPYAISEPFSTAGKINLNYQIVPFTHIKRSTGLRAALQPLRVSAVPIGDVGKFKTTLDTTKNYRYIVDRDETIKAFDYYFNQGYQASHDKGFLKSAAQICEFYLYPRQGKISLRKWDSNNSDIKRWWTGNSLTGDNVREKPYADLYPRITTKSNTFCVHVRAQTLRQSSSPSSVPTDVATWYRTWDEKRDRVVSEYRGSSIIERYIDPQDERFKSGSKEFINPDKGSVEKAYRFRVLNTKRFNP